MNLIFIYGAPGVGKLTVAKELARVTGYNLFHNHLTVDLVSSIFPFSTKAHSDLVEKIRLDLIEVAAREKVRGMIFTFVYGVETFGGKTDDKFVQRVIDSVKKYRGRILFVKLFCDKKELHRRLQHPSRKAFGKLRKVKILQSIRKRYDLDATIPFGKNLIINNTTTPAKKTAASIKAYYKLP